MADRQRRYRQRQREGVSVYRVPTNERVVRALIEANRLTEEDSGRPERIESEIAAVLVEWAARWVCNIPLRVTPALDFQR